MAAKSGVCASLSLSVAAISANNDLVEQETKKFFSELAVEKKSQIHYFNENFSTNCKSALRNDAGL